LLMVDNGRLTSIPKMLTERGSAEMVRRRRARSGTKGD
jgi:hypothetical protein